MPRFRFSLGMLIALLYTSRPSIEMVPLSGFSSPAIILRRVVLPHPLGPNMDIISPLFICIETSDTATDLPNFLLMLLQTNVEVTGF